MGSDRKRAAESVVAGAAKQGDRALIIGRGGESEGGE